MKTEPLITCIGEALVDFVATVSGVTLAGAPGFIKACGGEGANVAAGIARLGGRVALVGKVGDDSFGKFILRELGERHIDVRGIRADRRCKTRLAFVSVTKTGERAFEFWERHPAGEQLRYRDISKATVFASRIVNIGPLLLLNDPARSTALRIARAAKRRGCDVAFDPNLRRALWKSASEMKRVTLAIIRQCTILRLNADEAMFLTGMGDMPSAALRLSRLGPRIVIMTLGARGAFFRIRSETGTVKGFNVNAIDTTGCGDGFFAGVLVKLAALKGRIDSVSSDTMREICIYGNAVGALTTLKRGAARALPSGRQVQRFLKTNRSSAK